MALRMTARRCVVAGILVLFSAFSKGADVRLPVTQLYDSLTPMERVGQLLDLRLIVRPGTVGHYARLIREHHIGSVTILGGSLSAFIALMDSIRDSDGLPVHVSCTSDEGIGLALDSVPRLPTLNTLSQIRADSLVLKLGEELAGEMQSLRIDQYHTEATAFRVENRNIAVSRTARAIGDHHNDRLFHKALLRSGAEVLMDLTIRANLEDIRRSGDLNTVLRGVFAGEELNQMHALFRDAPLHAVTLSLQEVPYFSADASSTFRQRFFNDLVHRYLGHQGLILADMNAIRQNRQWQQDSSAVVALLNAGCHIISGGEDIGDVASVVQRAVTDREIDPYAFRLKVQSVLSARLYTEKDTTAMVRPAAMHRALFNPGMHILQKNIYKNTTNAYGTDCALLPFQPDGSQFTATLTIGGSSATGFRKLVDRYALATHYDLPHYSYDPHKMQQLRDRLSRYDRIIVALYSDPFTVMDERIQAFLGELSDAGRSVLVSFGDPGMPVDRMPFDVAISAPEANQSTESLAVQLIFGAEQYPFSPSAIGATGLSPVYGGGAGQYNLGFAIPEEHEMDSRTLNRIDDIVREAIDMRATPGCQILVARNGKIVFDRNYGFYTYDSIRSVTSNTLYDLASVTKVAVTTQLVMMLHDRGLLDLDARMSRYLPELKGTNKEEVVISDVLAHQAGLRPFYPFWVYTVDADSLYYSGRPSKRYNLEVADGMYADERLLDSLWHWTMRTRMLRKRRGSYEYKYSDLGFYLLDRLLQRLLGTTLDAAADSLIFKPMGLGRTTFRPLCRFPRDEIAPTEDDRLFRPGLVWGTVHDQIAAMSGGVGGHAGLFGTATDMAKIMMMHLQDGVFAGNRLIRSETVQLFSSIQNKKNRRGLGWDKPEHREHLNPVSRYASMSSFGHRGFTGTIVWADPTFNLIFVFLSNRVYPNARNTRLIDFNVRKRIQDLVYESIWDFEKYHYR